MSKSIKRLLIDASELIDMAGVTHADSVDVSVFCQLIQIHLKPMALARVFRDFDLPRTKLNTKFGGDGDLHIHFQFKGAFWRCVVMRHEIAEWHERVGYATERLTSKQQRLSTPPPSRHIAQPRSTTHKVLCLPATASAATNQPPANLPGQRTLFAQ